MMDGFFSFSRLYNRSVLKEIRSYVKSLKNLKPTAYPGFTCFSAQLSSSSRLFKPVPDDRGKYQEQEKNGKGRNTQE